ncbi:vesicle transport protein USE1-like [Hydractinia symbiolongicarpus]|uniref:vesicle transport protein USE1-like n=1 Tax=Hydractinia symbiolongicarpus TaxID=13093 RepID=UPI0025514712|nr:vesicle transport protein USE1-like [Hydractinia symbiolongicarpus]XP_057312018.1 vesicle transport protein USE1-like [Hydractinia symbiolongicarpus]
MGKSSRKEINIRRLLAQCEVMASDCQHNECKIDWRLAKYLKHLDKEIEALKKDQMNPPTTDVVRDYERKVEFLKGIVKADEVDDPLERTLLCHHLLPSTVISGEQSCGSHTKELHLQVKGKHQKELRQQLFGGEDALRKRKVHESSTTKDNISHIIKQHHDMQEKVAEEMIKMAISMKENSLAARDIIQTDNQELERATKVTESNYKKLKTESDRLEELNKKTCSCTIWIMLAIVCVVFINMIIFIKFFPKRKTY